MNVELNIRALKSAFAKSVTMVAYIRLESVTSFDWFYFRCGGVTTATPAVQVDFSFHRKAL